MNYQPIKIIYILSSGHSGSTLTDLILGSHSKVESVGEIAMYWRRYSNDFSLKNPNSFKNCTCEKLIEECEYWQNISEKAIVLRKSLSRKTLQDASEFELNNYALLRAVTEVCGKGILCDSSKDFERLKAFLKSEWFDVEIIHLVRDPRAVSYSIKRKGLKLDNTSKYNYFDELKSWKNKNLNYLHEFSKGNNYHLIKYEDLVENPHGAISKLMSDIGLEFEPQQIDYGQVIHHNFGGNRMRFKSDKNIQKDCEYLVQVSPSEWWISTIYTVKLLRKLSYPLLRKA